MIRPQPSKNLYRKAVIIASTVRLKSIPLRIDTENFCFSVYIKTNAPHDPKAIQRENQKRIFIPTCAVSGLNCNTIATKLNKETTPPISNKII